VDDLFAYVWSHLAGRVNGPFSFRFVFQPLMAVLCAARDGIVDAREGRPPYFWRFFSTSDRPKELLREAWKAVARVITLGVVMDVMYQLMVFHWIHPFELVVIVMTLAFAPYLLLRGPITRIVRLFIRGRARTS
jgi:hypothetical protein